MKMRGKKKKKRWHSPFFCFRKWWTGRCVCKSIRVHAHTQAYTHYPRLDPQSVQSVPGRWSERALNLTCFVCLLPLNLPTSTQWFPTFHRMTWQHPENLLGLVFHFCKRWTDQNRESKRFQIEKKIKIAPFTMDLKVGGLCSLSNCLTLV